MTFRASAFHSQVPRGSHRDIDESVGLFVTHKPLRYGIVLQLAAQPYRDARQVQERSGSVRLLSIGMNTVHVLTRANGMLPTVQVRPMGGGFHRSFKKVGRIGLPIQVLAVWSLEDRQILRGALTPLAALDDEFVAVCILELDPSPQPASIVVLRPGRVRLHLDGAGVVLPQAVLDRVDQVLPHVAETSFVVVPVPTEALMDPVGVVRFEGRRAQPHVVVELRGYRLRRQIRSTSPQLGLEAAVPPRDERLAQQAAHHHMAHECTVVVGT